MGLPRLELHNAVVYLAWQEDHGSSQMGMLASGFLDARMAGSYLLSSITDAIVLPPSM